MDNTTKRPVGPVIGLVVILAIIILGGIYFWQTRAHTAPAPTNTATSTTQDQTPDDFSQIQTQSSSDDTAAINGDLNTYSESDINNVDQGL